MIPLQHRKSIHQSTQSPPSCLYSFLRDATSLLSFLLTMNLTYCKKNPRMPTNSSLSCSAYQFSISFVFGLNPIWDVWSLFFLWYF